tara:strand:+ start:1252 stop:1434 length:183 start_codon:yes stop_codon:yes gene_type:complete
MGGGGASTSGREDGFAGANTYENVPVPPAAIRLGCIPVFPCNQENGQFKRVGVCIQPHDH